MVTGMVLEELEVETVVLGPEVSLLAVVAALGEVVGDAWENQAGESGHIRYSADLPPEVLRGRSGTEVCDPIGQVIDPVGPCV
jgi:hypothetical protein